MRLLLALAVLLAWPSTAAAAELSFTLETTGGVQFGGAHEAEGFLTQDGLPLGGQQVEILARAYPYDGDFELVTIVTTEDDGGYGFRHKFDRNVQLMAATPAQGLSSAVVRAYVFPRPRSRFVALADGRLRITQILRTPPGVKLTAPSIFYLGPPGAKRAKRFGSAKPKRIGRGRFRARKTVRLPDEWNGRFRYASCFRYSKGSGLGDPRAHCPRRWKF